jgi:hypothetical protein
MALSSSETFLSTSKLTMTRKSRQVSNSSKKKILAIQRKSINLSFPQSKYGLKMKMVFSKTS